MPTAKLPIDYLRPASVGELVAQATGRRQGRSLAVAGIDVLDADGRLVALGRGPFALPPPGSPLQQGPSRKQNALPGQGWPEAT